MTFDHSKRSFTRFLFATANTLLCEVRLYELDEHHSSRSPLSEKLWSLITVFDSLLERARNASKTAIHSSNTPFAVLFALKFHAEVITVMS